MSRKLGLLIFVLLALYTVILFSNALFLHLYFTHLFEVQFPKRIKRWKLFITFVFGPLCVVIGRSIHLFN